MSGLTTQMTKFGNFMSHIDPLSKVSAQVDPAGNMWGLYGDKAKAPQTDVLGKYIGLYANRNQSDPYAAQLAAQQSLPTSASTTSYLGNTARTSSTLLGD